MAETGDHIVADPTAAPDHELLAAFVERHSEAAFEQLLQRHETLVLGVCRRFLNDADAEDAAQAVFLTLAHKAAALRREGSLAGWLHRVAWQVALNQRKSAAARQRREQAAGAVVESNMQANATDPQQQQLSAELKRAVDGAVAGLPSHYREVILLHHFEQLTQEQTAQRLGEPPGTVSMRLHRAREMLRERLAADGLTLPAVFVISETTRLGAAKAAATLKAAMAIANGAAAAGLVSTQVAVLTKGALSMLLIARLKLAALVAVCLLTAASTVGWVAFSGQAADSPPRLQAETPPTAPAAFVPTGGKLSAPIRIARAFPGAHRLIWNFDNTKLIVVIDTYFKEFNGGISREGPDEYDTYVVDLATQKAELRYEKQGMPEWLSGGRMLIRLDGKLTVVEPDGRKRELPGQTWFKSAVSRDGKYVAYRTASAQDAKAPSPLMFFNVETGAVTELAPPVQKPAEAGLVLQLQLGFWTNDHKLCIGTAWSPEKQRPAFESWTRWFYTPATGAYETTEMVGSSFSLQPYVRRKDNLMLDGGVWLTTIGPKDWKEPVVPQKESNPLRKPGEGRGGEPGGKERFGGGGPGEVEPDVMPAEAFELRDSTGKTLKRVALDTAATGGAGIHLLAVSADKHYALAGLYKKKFRMSGMGFPDIDRTCVIDLLTGKVSAVLQTGEIDVLHARPIGIFSATKQVLIVSRLKKSGNTCMWSFGFDDKAPKEWTLEKRLPRWMPDTDGTRPWRAENTITGTEPLDWDRLTLVAVPMDWQNVLDPRYETSPWQLFVFWNSARPLRAFVSDGRATRPTNITWTHDGNRLAFTAGMNVYVWTPEANGTEAPLPGAAPKADF